MRQRCRSLRAAFNYVGEADLFGVCHALVKVIKDAPIIDIWGIDRMVRPLKFVRESSETFCLTQCVVKQEHRRHLASFLQNDSAAHRPEMHLYVIGQLPQEKDIRGGIDFQRDAELERLPTNR